MENGFDFCGLELPNNVFLAPMAGITTRPFRTIALSFGAGMVWTEMISAEGLIRNDEKTRAFLPVGDEGGAVAVQLFGHRPETLRDAALIAEETPAQIIDINMGCPVRKVVRNGSGAALMRDPQTAGRLISAVCRAVKKPVTVKIRSGWDHEQCNAENVAAAARDNGAAAVTVHGRTAKQGFSGKADWSVVARVSRSAGIPVVGSGDLTSPAEVEAALAHSGCSAAMVGRAALGRPWIFRDVQRLRRGVAAGKEERSFVAGVMERHLALNLEFFGPERGVILMRRPLAWYSRGLEGAAHFRQRVNTVLTAEGMRDEIRSFSEGKFPLTARA